MKTRQTDIFQRLLLCLLVAIGLGLAPATAMALPGMSVAQAPVSHEDDLRVMADFFYPGAPIKRIMHETCGTGYRTHLESRADEVEVERKLPGIHDAMIAASMAHCDREMDKAIAARHERIKADWSTMVGPADLHRLAILLAPSTQEALDASVVARPGDTATRIAQRLPDVSADQDRRFHAALRVFGRTAGGTALLNRVQAYQAQLNVTFQAEEGAAGATIARGALVEAHRAANAFGRAHGLQGDLYATP